MTERLNIAFDDVQALMEDPITRVLIDFYGLEEAFPEEYQELQAALMEECLEQFDIFYDNDLWDWIADDINLIH